MEEDEGSGEWYKNEEVGERLNMVYEWRAQGEANDGED